MARTYAARCGLSALRHHQSEDLPLNDDAQLTVYGMRFSGNCYKVQLLLEQLGRPYRWVETDIMQGLTRTPEFLARNPNGRVPLLELADGRTLAESNAILCHLAEGSALWPLDPWERAQALQWLFFEQYSHEPYIAVARFIACMLPADHPRRAEFPRLHQRGHGALDVMEQHLAKHAFFVGERYGVADIALFAYTHVADEGGFSLERYPAIQAWMASVRGQPGFVPLQA
jgi:glutathione S-transferase